MTLSFRRGSQTAAKQERFSGEPPAMIHLTGGGARLCDGVTRREFLRAGGLALAGLTLPTLLESRAAAVPRARRCVQLFMWGGPAQQETFDLKPDAPEG